MKLIITKYFLTHLIFLIIFPVFGQVKIKNIQDVKFIRLENYLITLKDKTTLLGKYHETKGEQIIFHTNNYSKLSAHINDIKHIRKINPSQIKNGKWWETNNHANSYFFGQSAFNILKNDVNLYNNMGFYTALEYGITNHISISGGLNLFSVFAPNDYESLNIISAKVGGFSLGKNVTIGLSSFYGKNEDDTHLSLNGLLTIGNQNSNFTLGMGAYRYKTAYYYYPYYNDNETKTTTTPTYSIAGMWRVSKVFYLMTENWITTSDETENVLSIGFRIAGSQFLLDLGLFNLIDNGEYLPYIGSSYKFK